VTTIFSQKSSTDGDDNKADILFRLPFPAFTETNHGEWKKTCVEVGAEQHGVDIDYIRQTRMYAHVPLFNTKELEERRMGGKSKGFFSDEADLGGGRTGSKKQKTEN
jgi:hypothetical protein